MPRIFNMDEFDCYDIPAIPQEIRRCSNPKCNCVLRRGNRNDMCAVCTRKFENVEKEQVQDYE